MTRSLAEEQNTSDTLQQRSTAEHMSRIFQAASLVMGLFVISRALGLLREMVIASQFGTSAEMDAYLAAFRIPDFLFYIPHRGVLKSQSDIHL